jgi:hypothetical protein
MHNYNVSDGDDQSLITNPSYHLSSFAVEIITTLKSYGYQFIEKDDTVYVQGYTGIRLNLRTGKIDGYQGKNQKSNYKIAFAVMGIFACASGFAGTVSKGVFIALASAISTYFLNLDGCIKAIDDLKRPSYLLCSVSLFSAAITAAQAYQGSTEFLTQETNKTALIALIAILAAGLNLIVSCLFNIDALGNGIKTAYLDYQNDYNSRQKVAKAALSLLFGNPNLCFPIGLASFGMVGTLATTTARATPAFSLAAHWWPNYEEDYLQIIRLTIILILCTLASGVGLAMFQAAIWRLYLLIMLIGETVANLARGTLLHREITSANSIIFGTITILLTSGVLGVSAWASLENYRGLANQAITGLDKYFLDKDQIERDLSIVFSVIVDMIGGYAAANMMARFGSIRKTMTTIIAKMRMGFIEKNAEILNQFYIKWQNIATDEQSNIAKIMRGEATIAPAIANDYLRRDSEA